MSNRQKKHFDLHQCHFLDSSAHRGEERNMEAMKGSKNFNLISNFMPVVKFYITGFTALRYLLRKPSEFMWFEFLTLKFLKAILENLDFKFDLFCFFRAKFSPLKNKYSSLKSKWSFSDQVEMKNSNVIIQSENQSISQTSVLSGYILSILWGRKENYRCLLHFLSDFVSRGKKQQNLKLSFGSALQSKIFQY